MSTRNSTRSSSRSTRNTVGRSRGSTTAQTPTTPSTTGGRRADRVVYDVANNGVYENSHEVSNLGMSIRREDTRHGGTSEVRIYRAEGDEVSLTLREARSLKAFLDRELELRAR